MTTDEIATALSQSTLDRRNVHQLVELFLEADLVQFSNYSPQAYRKPTRHYDRAREFVEATKPAVEGTVAAKTGSPQPIGGNRVNELTFHSPLLLLLLPMVLLPAALPYLWRQRMGPATMRYADIGLFPSTRMSLRLRLFPFVSMLRYLALALVIVAAARPQLADAREIIRGEGVDIAIALDVSGSMGEADFEPNRLGAAKDIISDFIASRSYDRIGLVVFSRDAFIQSPPTLDHRVLERLLRDINLAGEMGIEDGTAIGSGMATAANMLKDSGSESKLVTLITDGVNNAGELDPITVATAAEAVGIKLYTIGVGTAGEDSGLQPETSAAETAAGENPLDEATLRQIADITNAKYYRATDEADLRNIYAEINALEKSDVEIVNFVRYREIMAWFLATALVLVLLEFALSNTIFRKMP